MNLSGLHLLLTYQCNFACDHCFVWGSPKQSGTMRLVDIREILTQAQALGTVEWIYFEGGEPSLYYSTLVKGVAEAAERGFKVGIVSNGYWATAVEDAVEWLRPLAGLVQDLSVSCDLFHGSEASRRQAERIRQAGEQLGIPVGVISITAADDGDAPTAEGQLPLGESGVMFRGRAAISLADKVPPHPWTGFDECPYENLREPGRVHVDPLGNVHICQGISLGNLFETPLTTLCARYKPENHPITGPLLGGGPAELARRYGIQPEDGHADACHLCYQTRVALRERFPAFLAPDQMYGLFA